MRGWIQFTKGSRKNNFTPLGGTERALIWYENSGARKWYLNLARALSIHSPTWRLSDISLPEHLATASSYSAIMNDFHCGLTTEFINYAVDRRITTAN